MDNTKCKKMWPAVMMVMGMTVSFMVPSARASLTPDVLAAANFFSGGQTEAAGFPGWQGSADDPDGNLNGIEQGVSLKTDARNSLRAAKAESLLPRNGKSNGNLDSGESELQTDASASGASKQRGRATQPALVVAAAFLVGPFLLNALWLMMRNKLVLREKTVSAWHLH